MTFEKLFRNCAYDVKYQECGDHVNYAFVESGRTLYIYFEGSNGDVDWRRNFSYWRKPYKDMTINYRVHGGFLAAWKEVQDIVVAKIKETKGVINLDYKWQKIVVIGYSHGGALAAFAHECVWYHRPDIRDNCWGISFEGPRIYSGFWVKGELQERWKNFRVFRNRADIVTHMPPCAFGFCHVGEMVKIGGKWKPFAALWQWIKSGLKDTKALREIVAVWPHYQSEMVKSLKAFDESEDGKMLRIDMGLDER